MKKLFLMMALIVFFGAGIGSADVGDYGGHGPAPNSGDGIPDGSGFESNNGPNNSGATGSGTGPAGPAPNSGDGVPDGSGFDSNFGPNGAGTSPDFDNTDGIDFGSASGLHVR